MIDEVKWIIEKKMKLFLKKYKKVKDKVKENNSVFLEKEFLNIFLNYLCLIKTLKNEWKIKNWKSFKSIKKNFLEE